jgi:hypothetical protein
MGGEDCCRHQRWDDPDPPWECGNNGPKGATTVGCNARAPPPHIDGSNDHGGGCGGAPCLLLSLFAVAAAWGQCHGDNGNNSNDDSNDSVHSDGSKHSNGGNGNSKGTLLQLLPPSLPMQLLVLACFVILCLLLFWLLPLVAWLKQPNAELLVLSLMFCFLLKKRGNFQEGILSS